MANTASIMKKKKVVIGIILCFLILCSICKVSGNVSNTVLETSKDHAPHDLTSAGLKNPSAQSTPGDKRTDVDMTPSVSSPTSTVHIKHPLVNNQDEASEFKDEYSQHGGTSTISEVDMNVRPKMRTSSGLRWNVALERRDTGDHGKKRRNKKKKKHIYESTTEIPADSNSIIILGGLIGGVFMLLAVLSCFIQLCKYCKRHSARRLTDLEAVPGTSSLVGQVGKEDMNVEENIFEKDSTERQKVTTSKQISQSSPGYSNATSRGIQLTNNTTGTPISGGCPLPPVCTVTGNPEVRINMEYSDITLPESFSSASVRSEPSNYKTNESPQSTPVKARLAGSLPAPPNSASGSEDTTCPKETKLETSTEPIESADKVRLEDETGSTPVTDQSAPMTNPLTKEVPNQTLTDTFSISKDSKQQKSSVAMETGATNSSNESCKTPIAPCSDVIITVEDDDESKLSLLIERSTAEVVYARNESKTDTITDMDDKVPTDEGIPPPPPPPTRPMSASTELRQGKSMIGGRKALENRRFIKHLTSGQHSSGFHGDLNKAVNKIMSGNKLLADKSKEKRKVIKQQAKEPRISLKENILKAKSVVMNEKMDSVRDKKSALRRRIIHKALSHPTDSKLQPHTPLSKEIAFAKSVILPSPIQQKTERKTKERGKVVKELVDELNKPSFEDVIKILAETLNPDGKTRDMNNGSEYKRNVVKMDAKMLKAKSQKSSFLLDIQFARNVICGQSAFDHDQNPRKGCLCYYCVKHWKKTGGSPCFKLPSNFSIAKDVYLINGKIYIRNPRPYATRRGSSSEYRPGIDTAAVLLNAS